MERLNKAFKQLNWETAVIKHDYEHKDLVATVWAEYTGHRKPNNICLGVLRNYLKSTYNAWNNWRNGRPTVGWNYIPKQKKIAKEIIKEEKQKETKPTTKTIKKQTNKKKNKKKGPKK